MVRGLVLALLMLMSAATGWMTWRMNGTLESMALPAQDVIVNPSYTASWKDADGITHTVSTPRNGPSEPIDEWAARHKANVDALKALFPPVA